MRTLAYITIDQFIVLSGGAAIGGKKDMTKERIKKPMEAILMGRPQRPSEKRELSNGSPRILLAVTQPIETMYDESKAQTPREII